MSWHKELLIEHDELRFLAIPLQDIHRSTQPQYSMLTFASCYLVPRTKNFVLSSCNIRLSEIIQFRVSLIQSVIELMAKSAASAYWCEWGLFRPPWNALLTFFIHFIIYSAPGKFLWLRSTKQIIQWQETKIKRPQLPRHHVFAYSWD